MWGQSSCGARTPACRVHTRVNALLGEHYGRITVGGPLRCSTQVTADDALVGASAADLGGCPSMRSNWSDIGKTKRDRARAPVLRNQMDTAPMGIANSSRVYETWLGKRLRLLPTDFQRKHQAMAQDLFPF